MKAISKGLSKTFSRPCFWALAFSVFLNVLFLHYLVLLQTTTWSVFWQANKAIYNYLQVIFSLLNATLVGIAVAMFFYLLEKKARPSFLETLGSLVFSTVATGCTVCGAVLLPLVGLAASLVALPFGGLEVKLLSALLLVYAIWEYAKLIAGVCPHRAKIITLTKGGLEFNLNRQTLPRLKPLAVLAIFVLLIYSLPKLPKNWRLDWRRQPVVAGPPSVAVETDEDRLFAQINPADGYEINAGYQDLGPKMLALGLINLDKFKGVYQQAGQPLTTEQLEILAKGSNSKIKITPQNSYFLLNFFWALGLANKNKILTEGDIVKYSQGQVGSFASTGGWTLADEEATRYLAKTELISLNADQQRLVEEVSGNVYRPCCNNTTSFPDCNHGMALLGVLELMASQGATEAEMYQASKYFNAFWFPQSYYDLALYFQTKEGKDFADVDPKLLLSKDFSSVSGWQNTKNWLAQSGVVKEAPRSGGGCGV